MALTLVYISDLASRLCLHKASATRPKIYMPWPSVRKKIGTVYANIGDEMSVPLVAGCEIYIWRTRLGEGEGSEGVAGGSGGGGGGDNAACVSRGHIRCSRVLGDQLLRPPKTASTMSSFRWGGDDFGKDLNIGDRGTENRMALPFHNIGFTHILVRSVRAGNQHSLFLHASGRVSALGSDAKGQPRGLHTTEDVQAISCSWNGSYLQTRTRLLSAGASARGHLGKEGPAETALGPVNVPDTSRVVDFVCGSEHVLCVLESQGQAEVWGWNENGNLATGHWARLSRSKLRRPRKLERKWLGCGLGSGDVDGVLTLEVDGRLAHARQGHKSEVMEMRWLEYVGIRNLIPERNLRGQHLDRR
ncbi:regulator of chromosome condensation 1/beta-lactamase-inhibitor protein II [Lactarius deliciosus]|nr:regulator of chromosome condensation 1/beta-lactamase-inhibitor protein II [Lactarius deliciosus]